MVVRASPLSLSICSNPLYSFWFCGDDNIAWIANAASATSPGSKRFTLRGALRVLFSATTLVMAANIAETNKNMLENIGSCATSTLERKTSTKASSLYKRASASLVPSCGGAASMEDLFANMMCLLLCQQHWWRPRRKVVKVEADGCYNAGAIRFLPHIRHSSVLGI